MGAFVEDAALAAVVAAARDEEGGHAVRDVWVFDEGGLDRLRELGSHLPDAEADAAVAGVGLDDVATIIYTSGTTGLPKGVVLTHGNFVNLGEETIALITDVLREPGASLLLFLLLAHIFARVMEVIMLIAPVPWGTPRRSARWRTSPPSGPPPSSASPGCGRRSTPAPR